MSKVSLAKPWLGLAEFTGVFKVLWSGNLAQGPKVATFEKQFSELVENRECVAVNSGTSALHVSLLALGIGPGDEVILPSFTFAATANVVKLVGAKPVFVDIDLATFNISPEAILESITDKTKAVMVVHLYGLCADMPRISEICKENNLKLIEDAAQAHGASINGKPAGSWGDAAAFSFYPTKNITSGEGGMIVLKETNVARTCRLLRNQGMEVRYQNEIAGYNLRMTDIHAAIGSAQLSRLKKINAKRNLNAQYFLKNITRFVSPTTPLGYEHVYHQFTIRVEKNRAELMAYLEAKGIGSGVYYPVLIHKLPAFNQELNLRNSEIACAEVLSIPIHPRLRKKDLRKIVKALESFEVVR